MIDRCFIQSPAKYFLKVPALCQTFSKEDFPEGSVEQSSCCPVTVWLRSADRGNCSPLWPFTGSGLESGLINIDMLTFLHGSL